MTTTLEYRNKITYLSFIMALLIIVRHSVGLDIYQEHITGGLYYIEFFTSHFTDVIVPVFFAISGYLFFQNFDYTKLKGKWYTRSRSLLVPFIIWNLIGFMFTWTLYQIPQIRNSINKPLPDYDVVTWFIDVFIKTQYNITWFIRNLIVYVIVTPLFYIVLKSKWSGAFLLTAAIVTSYIISNDYITYSSPWLLGAYVGIHFKDYCKKCYDKRLLTVCACLLLCSFIIECMSGCSCTEDIILLRLIQIPLIWISADILAINKEPSWWMRISFFIYCSHHMILESVEKIFLILLGKNYTGALLDFIFAPMITLLIILCLAAILRRIHPVWAVLCGGRT